MRNLVTILTITLLFMAPFAWINDSTAGSRELTQEVSGKNRGDINLSGEKKGAQKKEDNTGLAKPLVKTVLDTPDEQKAEAQSPSIDLLERAAIRYRNMIDNVSKEENSAKGLNFQSEDISDEIKINEKAETAFPGLNAKNSFESGLTDITKESVPFLENPEQIQNQFSAIPEETCLGLRGMLEVIQARLNTIHKEISYFQRH